MSTTLSVKEYAGQCRLSMPRSCRARGQDKVDILTVGEQQPIGRDMKFGYRETEGTLSRREIKMAKLRVPIEK